MSGPLSPHAQNLISEMCALAYIREHTLTLTHTDTKLLKSAFQSACALETAAETKWDLYLYGKIEISCLRDVLAAFAKLWFDLCTGNCE